jgi:NAD(P)-dependent dehydrogenase (short-subunit alcohol dehydrogenase family)
MGAEALPSPTTMDRFEGQCVLVAGGGSGIGRAAARAFAREGASVTVVGRRSEPLAETVALIEGDGGRASALAADLSRGDDAARAVDAAAASSALDVAVNAIGMTGAGAKVADIDEETWSAVIATNLTGIWQAMKHEIARMREGGGGAIVNVASNIGAHSRREGFGAYAASKAAVSALTRTAAREYIADGIRINAISPGPTDTPMSLRPGESEADRAERLATALPIGRVGALDEITATILWLASPEAGFTVGHDLVVDGGATA